MSAPKGIEKTLRTALEANGKMADERREMLRLLEAWVDWSHPGAKTVAADTRALLARAAIAQARGEDK